MGKSISRFICLFTLLPALTLAQLSTAELAGRLTDQTGAIIAGAHITLHNTATGIERSAQTNDQGYYVFGAVQPGPYAVTARKEGFPDVKRDGIELQVDQRARVDLELKVGQVSGSVTVDASAVEVRTSSAELGSVVQQKQVVDMPLNGRNFTQLLLLTPGASPVSVGQNKGGGGSPAVGAFAYPSINGQSNRSLLFFTDGVNNTNTFMTSYSVPPIVDAIQEFKVQSHNDQAQVGMAVGGVVNVVTKSGSNAYHGSAWEFMRNNVFDARNTFRTGVTALRQNMFGGALGGPIRRNHTFFFIAYQGYTNRTPANNLYRTPTAANLQGDLSDWPRQIFDPFSTRQDPANAGAFVRDAFPRNQIPASRIDQGFVAYAKATLPAPIVTGVADRNQLDLNPSATNQHEYTARVDHSFSQRDSVWMRWSALTSSNTSSAGRQTLESHNDLTPLNVGASWVHTFGAASLIEVQFGRAFAESEGGNSFTSGGGAALASATGFDQTFCCSFHSGRKLVPSVVVPQFFTGGESYNQGRNSNLWQYRLNYSIVRGDHELKFGGEFNKLGLTVITNDHEVDFDPSQTGDPRNLASTGSPLASFLLDVPIGAARRDFNKKTRFGGIVGFYGQDSWRVTPRLTINMGLRMDYTMIPPLGNQADGTLYMGDLDLLSGTYWVLAAPGSCASLGEAPCVPTADGSLPDHVKLAPGGTLQNNYGANWQPRFGVAYKLSDKMALRGSFGIFYDNFSGVLQSAQNLGHTWPDIGRRLSSNFNLPTAQQPTPNLTGKNPFPTAALPNATPFNDGAFFGDPNFKNLYSMQWNIGIERAVTADSVVSVNYVGSGSRRLPIGGFFNVALTPGPGSAAARRPFPYITPTNFDRSWGRGNYDALQAQYRRRFTHGFTLLANYTWSKSIDTGCDGFYGVEGCSIQDPYHFNNDRSVTGTDLPQMFNLSWTWEVPLKMANRAANLLVHGWQFNGIATFFSGPPYTVAINGDIANTGNASGYMRPNLVGDPNAVSQTTAHWINTAAFAAPAQFTFGNAGRNILRSQGAHNFDLSVFRSFPVPLREGMRVEFRGEAFNAFNTPRYAAPVANLSQSNFGQVLATANAERQFQFGAKIIF